MMKRKSSKRKKRRIRVNRRPRFQDYGKLLTGIAALLKVIFDLVIWLSAR